MDANFLSQVIRGLSASPKWLPTQLFYDKRGSQLFDEICSLPEYYPTRTETSILRKNAPEIAKALGKDCDLIEYGAGSLVKVRILLNELDVPQSYIPVDISGAHLAESVRQLTRWYPGLRILPVVADFLEPFSLPATSGSRRVVFFPGSTIGNFEPSRAALLLEDAARHAGQGGAVLIGIDLVKDIAILEAAYNDSEGVTAAFNLNMLARCNKELSLGSKLHDFRHEAHFNPEQSRIEMHLRCLRAHSLSIDSRRFELDEGELIRTEYSYKYTIEKFQDLARVAGLEAVKYWVDKQRWFSVHLLTCAGHSRRPK